MTCPQCSAELSDSATFCHRCGSSIRQVAFSYLPAGAPAWPTTIPARPVYGTLTAAHPLEQEADAAAAKAVAKPRRSARSILFMIALFILVPIVGVGATLGTLWANGLFPITTTSTRVNVPAPTQQTPGASSSPATQGNLPTPTSFQPISNTSSSSLGIQMKYPGSWVEDPTTDPTPSGLISADFHPQERIGISVTINRIPSKSLGGNSVTAQQVDQANIDAFKTYTGVNNVQTVQSTTPERTLGGTQWAQEDAQFTDNNNLPYHFMVISVLHNQYYYSLFVYAPTANYDEAMQKYFQPMFDSFQFQA